MARKEAGNVQKCGNYGGDMGASVGVGIGGADWCDPGDDVVWKRDSAQPEGKQDAAGQRGFAGRIGGRSGGPERDRRKCWVKFGLLVLMLLGLLFVQTPAYGQWKQEPTTGSPPERLPDRTTLVGQSGMGPFLKARLADEENNAKKRRAVVVVQTDGVSLVPATSEGIPKLSEAHLQYKLDNGPVQNSTELTWTFDDLSPGRHEIHVALAGNDNRIIGKGMTLTVTVP